MTADQVARWSAMARMIVDHVPGASIAQRLQSIAEHMDYADVPYVRRLVYGTRGGARPDTIYALGEALRNAGVPWCSGLLTIAITEPYRTHALGTIGYLTQRGAMEDDLRQLWPGLIRVVAADSQSLEFLPQSPNDVSTASFSDSQRRVIRRAFNGWLSKERTDGMPDVIRGYIAMRKAATTNQVTHEFFLALRGVESNVIRWMQRVESEWPRFVADFTSTDLDLNTLVGYRGLK